MVCKKPRNIHGKRVPCGHCIGCRMNKQREWSLRIKFENMSHIHSYFITLTYEDAYLAKNYSLVPNDLSNWLKRIRYYTAKELRYYACGEYGGDSKRPHYHVILFGLSSTELQTYLPKTWQNGFFYFKPLNEKRISYTTGYVMKKLFGNTKKEFISCGMVPPFSRMSKGMGKDFVLKNADYFRQRPVFRFDGKSYVMPPYFRKLLGMDQELFNIMNRQQLDQKIDLLEKKLKTELPEVEYFTSIRKKNPLYTTRENYLQVIEAQQQDIQAKYQRLESLNRLRPQRRNKV